jgi:hypothetical protein
MIYLRALPHDRIEFGKGEIGMLGDLRKLPWTEAGVARAVETRLGIELRVGSYVGRLIIPDRATIDIEEPYPGTVATCLAITTSGRKAGDQTSPSSRTMVSPWSAVAIRFQELLSAYVLHGIERRYISEMVTTSRPRGRIDIASTITRVRSRGREDQVTCTPRILTEDTPLNRVISAAAVRAEQLLLREGITGTLRNVRLASMALSGVRRDVIPDFAAARNSLEIRHADRDALLSLAELLVSGVPTLPSGERQDPDHPMTAWINAELLFEEAIRSIARAVVGDSGSVRAGRGDGVTLFQRWPQDPATPRKSADPDVVIRHKNGILLLDAKHSRHDEDFTEDELYQLIAHAGAYQALAAALVIPSRDKNWAATRWIGRDQNGVAYYTVSVDPTSATGMYDPIAEWITRLLTPLLTVSKLPAQLP